MLWAKIDGIVPNLALLRGVAYIPGQVHGPRVVGVYRAAKRWIDGYQSRAFGRQIWFSEGLLWLFERFLSRLFAR
jgi:hypothetical protein